MAEHSTDTFLPDDERDSNSVSPAIGEVLAERFVLLRRLGTGGTAHVFAARDLETGAEVAVKVLRSVSDAQIARLRQEVRIAQEATSDRLVRIFDLHADRNAFFLTMELVDRGSLRDEMTQGASMPAGKVTSIAIEAALALEDLHQLGILHRDVKPGNLLLTRENKVKLADFGLAQRPERAAGAPARGQVAGTYAYLSPELSSEAASRRSDLYSLGVVIYELLTGEIPPPDAQLDRGLVPARLADVVERLLKRDPLERYESAAEIVRDLQGHRRKSRWMPLAIAIVIALLGAATAWWMRESRTLPRIVSAANWGIRAVDSDGNTLWSTAKVYDPRHVVVVHRGWRRPLFATVLRRPRSYMEPGAHQLSLLDPRSGEVVSTVPLPDGGPIFRDYANRFTVASLLSADLDGDGYDEVIVSYVHAVWWPSYSVVYDLRRGEGRVVFAAGGHHPIAAAADLDGDGRKELLFAGINNKMGWDIGVAAVRVDFDRRLKSESMTLSPDGDWVLSSDEALAWYALLPPGRLVSAPAVTVDDHRRELTVHYVEGSVVLGFDGFERGSQSSLAPAARAAARRRAYKRLREARRLTIAGANDEAVREIGAAKADASRIADRWLAEWIARREAATLVKSGRPHEGEREFEQLAGGSDMPADTAFDAGTAFELAGDNDRALRWYLRGFGRGAQANIGRLKWEFLQGIVFVLCQERRWNEASDDIDRFRLAYPDQSGGSDWFRQYVVWRRGGAPAIADPGTAPPDVFLYWAIEFALHNGEPADRLLPRVDEYLTRVSESPALLWSAKAEVLDRLGRHDEALRVSSAALERVRRDRLTDVVARAHYDVVAERDARLHSDVWRSDGLSDRDR